MAEVKTLDWLPIDKNDKIGEMIDKLNYNFSQFAQNNGGIPGTPGKDGNDGMVTKTRSSIHYIKVYVSNSEYYKDKDLKIKVNCTAKEIADYYNEETPDDLRDGDIIIYGKCIYVFEKTNVENFVTGDFIKATEIIGEKGEKGETGNSAGNIPFDTLTQGGSEQKLITFVDKNINGIILEEKDKVQKKQIEWENNEKNSIIFSKSNTDGLEFLIQDKNNTNIFKVDTKIQHILDKNNNSSFTINDNSTKGSTYFSKNNLSIESENEIKIKSKKLSISSDLKLSDDCTCIFDEFIIGGTISLNDNNITISGPDKSKININCNTEINNTIGHLKENHNDLNNNDSCEWKINSDGEAYFYDLYINGVNVNKKIDNLDKKFATLNGGLLQFSNAVSDEEKKQQLRDAIGAASPNDLKIDANQSVNIFTDAPLGTIIMSAVHKSKYITDNVGCGLWQLCDGSAIAVPEQEDIEYTYDNKTKQQITKSIESFKTTYNITHTPNLSGRCPIGYGEYKYNNDTKSIDYTKLGLDTNETTGSGLRQIGGSHEISLELKNIPKHNHMYAGNEDMKKQSPYTPFKVTPEKRVKQSGGDKSDGYLYYTSYTGDGTPHSNMQPYIVLSYYMKISNSIASENSTNTQQTTE